MRTEEFHYDLPEELIAQRPLQHRDDSRMMVVNRADGSILHRHIEELPGFLTDGDVLVINDTKVVPARLFGWKTGTGGRAEVLLLEDLGISRWKAMCKVSGRLRAGMSIELAHGMIRALIVEVAEGGDVVLEISSDRPVAEIIELEGIPPLPPYIRRPDGPESNDRERYQTIYATSPGAVAAPTAGLHFTGELLGELERCGVKRATVTLHVGAGTFKPVKTEDVESHRMESERYFLPGETAAQINKAKSQGRRIVAVGTTTVRTLETAAANRCPLEPCSGRTEIFIRPPFKFRVVDALVTNFHLPKSTLIMMISAFAGRDLILRAYREAVDSRYRFYSYGDCMLIL